MESIQVFRKIFTFVLFLFIFFSRFYKSDHILTTWVSLNCLWLISNCDASENHAFYSYRMMWVRISDNMMAHDSIFTWNIWCVIHSAQIRHVLTRVCQPSCHLQYSYLFHYNIEFSMHSFIIYIYWNIDNMLNYAKYQCLASILVSHVLFSHTFDIATGRLSIKCWPSIAFGIIDRAAIQ